MGSEERAAAVKLVSGCVRPVVGQPRLGLHAQAVNQVDERVAPYPRLYVSVGGLGDK